MWWWQLDRKYFLFFLTRFWCRTIFVTSTITIPTTSTSKKRSREEEGDFYKRTQFFTYILFLSFSLSLILSLSLSLSLILSLSFSLSLILPLFLSLRKRVLVRQQASRRKSPCEYKNRGSLADNHHSPIVSWTIQWLQVLATNNNRY